MIMEMVTLVDAINCLISRNGKINEEVANFLEKQHRRIIVVTNTKDDNIKNNLKKHGFEIFNEENIPPKKEPSYFKKLLNKKNLYPENVFYFDHKKENLGSAMKAGITHLCLWDGDLDNVKKSLSGYNF